MPIIEGVFSMGEKEEKKEDKSIIKPRMLIKSDLNSSLQKKVLENDLIEKSLKQRLQRPGSTYQTVVTGTCAHKKEPAPFKLKLTGGQPKLALKTSVG